MKNNFETWVKGTAKLAGIEINGSDPSDIQVLDKRFYSALRSRGSLGLGESYMDGYWECKKLDILFDRLLSSGLQSKVQFSLPVILGFIQAKIFNLQSVRRAFQVGEKHYDIGNDLYTAMLGKTMAYSCGYWKDAQDLDEAQEAKLDLICRKLNLQKGQRILDIGSGWGSFAYHAAKKYGVQVVGVTVSKEQLKLALERCKGLPVEFRLQDYRTLKNEKFDHIVSIGMFEHVGSKNYRTFFKIAKNCLKENGLFLLHTIGSLKTRHNIDPWIGKYIFPNAMLPSLAKITAELEGLFVIEDVHNFGSDYDRTLMAWYENFQKSWPNIKDQYDERFYRMWNYYLLACAGSFRARYNQLWQIVLSPKGVAGGYESVR